MPLTPTQRPTREWPLLILALALVCAICIPLWQWSSGRQPAPPPTYLPPATLGAAVGPAANLLEPVSAPGWSKWTWQRVRSLLLGPEQIACYCCFTWAGFILLGRYLEVRRQRRAFELDLLPTDTGICILPEDARLLQRRV